jgi:soluble lytic murein transglycosylase-like protein
MMAASIFFAALLFSLSFVGEGKADIYIYKDAAGVLHFTNVPNHHGYRPFMRERGKNSSLFSLAPRRLEELIRSASERHGVDPHLVRAIMKVESNFNSQARSHKWAQGLMQLMPDTARLHRVDNVYDPQENVDGGVRHLKFLLNHYQGDLRLSLAAYNAGIKAVEKYKGIPPYSETRDYVRRVLDYHQRYQSNGTISVKEMASR